MNTSMNTFAAKHPVRMLLIAPVLGASLVIFLPIIGFYLVAYSLFMWVVGLSGHYKAVEN